MRVHLRIDLPQPINLQANPFRTFVFLATADLFLTPNRTCRDWVTSVVEGVELQPSLTSRAVL